MSNRGPIDESLQDEEQIRPFESSIKINSLQKSIIIVSNKRIDTSNVKF